MILSFLSRWRCEHNITKVTCPFFLQNQPSISATTRKIMQVQTLSNLRSAEFVLKLISQIFQNLNITSHEIKFVLGTHLLLQQRTLKNLWVFLWWLMSSSSFFPLTSRNENVLHILFDLFCFSLAKRNSNDSCFKQKKIHCKDRGSKLYFSKGIKNNPARSNFHCYGYHNCYLKNPKSYNYPIQSNAYLVGAFANITWNRWTSFK